MQNIGRAACDSIANHSTHQRMVVYLSSYFYSDPCVAVQLVATYHCDQAYAFDVSGTGSCATAYGTTPDSSDAELGIASDASDCDTDACVPSTSSIRQVLQHFSML